MNNQPLFELCAIDLVKVRFRVDEIRIMSEVEAVITPLLKAACFFEAASFSSIVLLFRFGLKDEIVPHYPQEEEEPIKLLQLALEVDKRELQKLEAVQFKRHLLLAVLRGLIHTGKRYGCPTEKLSQALAEQT